MWDSLNVSAQMPWNISNNPCFGSERYSFITRDGIQIPVNPAMPQSIAVDGKRIFVSDVFNSVIYFFFDGNFRGTFLRPFLK